MLEFQIKTSAYRWTFSLVLRLVLDLTRTEFKKIVEQLVSIRMSHKEFITAVRKVDCKHASHKVHSE